MSIWRQGKVPGLGNVTKLTWSANATQLEDKIARFRKELAAAPTIWGAGSLWWRQVLFDFSFGAKIPPRQLDDAAVAAFLEHQAYLEPREGERLDLAAFASVTQILKCVSDAMSWSRTQGQAKALQVELAGNRPLTVCYGTRFRGKTWVPGCRLVFPDTARHTGGRRSYWLGPCRDCQPNKHPERKLPKHVREYGI